MVDKAGESLLRDVLSKPDVSRFRHCDSPASFEAVANISQGDTHIDFLSFLRPKPAYLAQATQTFMQQPEASNSAADGGFFVNRKGAGDALATTNGCRDWVMGGSATPSISLSGRNIGNGIPTLVNNNRGTYGTVGTGGTVRPPTVTPVPRRDGTWGIVGEGGIVRPPTTTPIPGGARHSNPSVARLSKFGLLRNSLRSNLQFY